MPNGQPLFLDNGSALTHLFLCFPSFDYPGWATCKEVECSLSLFSYEMTALFLKFPCSSLVPSECGSHVRRTALNASSGPQPVILVLQRPALWLLYPDVDAGKGGRDRDTLCPVHCGLLITFFLTLPTYATKMPFSVLLFILLNVFPYQSTLFLPVCH